MTEQVKANLQGVLDNVIQNSAQLKKQIEDQEAQIAGGKDQLAKFESLIASLQVAINDEKLLEAVQAQAGANALVSPTLPAGSADQAPAGTVQ
jgi:hypothetical protein